MEPRSEEQLIKLGKTRPMKQQLPVMKLGTAKIRTTAMLETDAEPTNILNL
jgi:hypothetical protein